MLTDFSLTMTDGTFIGFQCEDPEEELLYLPEASDSPLTWEKLKEMDKNLRLYGTPEREEIRGWCISMGHRATIASNPSPYQGMHHISVLG